MITGLISDEGASFVNQIFKCLTKQIFNWTHFTSSSYQPQSHGIVEQCVGQLNKLINLYVKDDRDIADYLPFLEVVQRVTVSKSRGYSPYEILRGFQPSLKLSNNLLDNITPQLTRNEYVTFLRDRLKEISKDVTNNLLQATGQQK